MHSRKDIFAMIGHAYFRNSEARHEPGTGLELALEEMAARRWKTEALRRARLPSHADQGSKKESS
jgi:hypothetical protein